MSIIDTILSEIDEALEANEIVMQSDTTWNAFVAESNNPTLHFIECEGGVVREEQVFEGSEFKSFVCGGCGHWSIVGSTD